MEYEDLIGIPFVDGGRDLDGLDCWGLVRELYRRQGIDVPDYHISAMAPSHIAGQMSHDKTGWNRVEKPKVGTMVLLRLSPEVWANHVGICIGDGRFIHAYRSTGVCIDRLRRWKSRIVGYYEPGVKL